MQSRMSAANGEREAAVDRSAAIGLIGGRKAAAVLDNRALQRAQGRGLRPGEAAGQAGDMAGRRCRRTAAAAPAAGSLAAAGRQALAAKPAPFYPRIVREFDDGPDEEPMLYVRR